MALMVLLCFLSLGDFYGILAAPAIHKISAISMMRMTAETGSLSSLPVIPRANPHARENQYAFSVAIPFAPSPVALEEQPTTTVTVTTTEGPTTITLSPTPTT